MSRSIWKGYYLSQALAKKNIINPRKALKIWSRNSSIPQKLINHKVNIHNGRDFRYLTITRDHVGFKFGQFIFTRNFTRAPKTFKK